MAAPTFVAEYETAWNNGTSPKTTAAFNAQAGDVLVCFGMSEDQAFPLSTPTNTQGALTWTLAQSVVVINHCTCYVWTATVDANKTGMTVSVARSSGSGWFGANVLHLRDTDGIGTSAKANGSGAPAVGITTTAPDSAVAVAVADWTAASGASRTWRTVGVAATELTYQQTSNFTVYAARHANAGPAGAKTAGLTAPTGLTYSIVAVEILGTTSSIPSGSGTGTWTFTGTGTGKRTPKATGSGIYTFTGTATGKRVPKSAGAGAFTFSGSGTGKREPKGSGSGTFTFIGTAVGARASLGAGVGTFGWTGTAIGESNTVARDLHITATGQPTTSWTTSLLIGSNLTVSPTTSGWATDKPTVAATTAGPVNTSTLATAAPAVAATVQPPAVAATTTSPTT